MDLIQGNDSNPRKRGPEAGLSPPLKKQASLPDLFLKTSVTPSEVSLALENQILKTLNNPTVLGAISIGLAAHLPQPPWYNDLTKLTT